MYTWDLLSQNQSFDLQQLFLTELYESATKEVQAEIYFAATEDFVKYGSFQ